jgi:glycosyltransferase EpsF
MKQGNYDILHCHHDVMSAVYLTAATGLPFRKRIVHIHNTSTSLPTPNRIKAGIIREPMRQICLRFADDIVGISRDALYSLVKDAAANRARHRVVHYAVDTSRFTEVPVDPVDFRRRLGFFPEARILLFVGRMVPYKNPLFIVEILDRLAAEQKVVAVFAGAGELQDAVAEQAKQRGLSDRVRVLGFCADVPGLMVNSDMLLWPSIEDPKEGLGLGIIEAQAAGLPILMSLSVPEEAVVIPELVSSLSLESGVDAWSKQVVEILNRPRPDRDACRVVIEQSDFSIDAGVRNLMQLYEC